MENMLTARRLPLRSTVAKDTPKYRIDAALANMVHAAVTFKNPGLKIGRRFSLEYALQQWLHNEGLVETRIEIDTIVTPEKNGNNS